MRKFIYTFFVFVFLSSVAFGQIIKCEGEDCTAPLCKDMKGIEYYEHSKGMTDKDKKRVKKSKWSKNYYQGKPFTGTIYHCPQHLGGRVTKISNWKNGMKNGVCKKWFEENGKLEYIFHFKEGKAEGKGYWYYSNGLLKKSENYKNGLREGLLIKYDEKGEIISKTKYSKGKVVSE